MCVSVCGPYLHPKTNFSSKEHTEHAWTDVPPPACRHPHDGITERTARCDTVKVSAESADAVSR